VLAVGYGTEGDKPYFLVIASTVIRKLDVGYTLKFFERRVEQNLDFCM